MGRCCSLWPRSAISPDRQSQALYGCPLCGMRAPASCNRAAAAAQGGRDSGYWPVSVAACPWCREGRAWSTAWTSCSSSDSWGGCGPVTVLGGQSLTASASKLEKGHQKWHPPQLCHQQLKMRLQKYHRRHFRTQIKSLKIPASPAAALKLKGHLLLRHFSICCFCARSQGR